MNKSILITGKQASGKSKKLNELLTKRDQSKSTIMTYKKFIYSIKSELKSKYDVIAIDEIISAEQINYLSRAISHFNFILIIATQLNVKELNQSVLSNFSIVECSRS